MADGWLFRLSATLGARQSAPSWPSAPTPESGAVPPAAPALRTAAPERTEPTPATASDDRSSD